MTCGHDRHASADSVDPTHRDPDPLWVTMQSTAGFIVSAMPAFLVGGSGIFLREEFGFGTSGLGLAVSTYFGCFALLAIWGGRLAERVGGGRSLKLTSGVSALVLLGIATLADELWHLVALLAVGGLVNSVGEPSSNLVLARGVTQRQAMMFGIKQMAMPIAALLAGASVPLVGLTVGWRWTFVIGAVLAVAAAWLVSADLARPQPRRAGHQLRDGDSATAPLVALAVAAGIGTAAASALPPFLVSTAVEAGVALGTAGWLLTVGSLTAALVRPVVGWYTDRPRGRALATVAAMMLGGAAGYALLASGSTSWLAIGSVLAFGLGWGWMGLLTFAVVRLNPNAPAAATGIMLAGAGGGAALGPVSFGVLVDVTSYRFAWTTVAVAALVAGVLTIGARLWVRHDRAAASSDSQLDH